MYLHGLTYRGKVETHSLVDNEPPIPIPESAGCSLAMILGRATIKTAILSEHQDV